MATLYKGGLTLERGTRTATGVTYSTPKSYFGTASDIFTWSMREYNSFGSSGINVCWFANGFPFSPGGSFQLIQNSDGQWRVQCTDFDYSSLTTESDKKPELNRFSKADYERSIAANSLLFSSRDGIAYWSSVNTTGNSRYRYEPSLELTHVFRHPSSTWAIDVFKNGIPQTSYLVAGDSLTPNSSPPIRATAPVIVEEECPPDTCSVDCGSYVCCYNSQGISTFNYTK